jgi:glucose dehydrogenase
MRTRIAVGALLVASALGVNGQPGGLDDQRLLGAGADRANWLTHGRDYGNQRFSPLAQIDAGNVARLRPAWIYQSGKRIWQFDSTPGSGWEGEFRTTTPDGVPLQRDIEREKASFAQYQDAWKRGGGSAWTTPAVDPARGLVYLGIGNPSPQMDDLTRPGDNLYTVSLVAVDVETGKLRWHYQQVPHDMWGYDVASPPVLFDARLDGARIPAVGQASKTGWLEDL